MAGGIRISSDGHSSRKTPAAPVAGKGKEIVQLTKEEQDSINRWNAKAEKKAEKKAAIEARIIADNKKLAKISGAGSSGTTRSERDTAPLLALEWKAKSRPATSSTPTSPKCLEAGLPPEGPRASLSERFGSFMKSVSPKRLEVGLPPEGPRASLSERFGSFMKSVIEYMDSPPPNNDPIIEEFGEMKQKGQRSLFNGFKLMSPYQQDAIQQTKEIFPRNFHDPKVPARQDQHAVVYHESGEDKLVPGPIKVGKNGAEAEPKGVSNRTATIKVHSRTYSPGSHTNFEPSMSDQIKARQNPNVDHIMQAPSLRGEENQYFIYTGKFPPRYYRLLPNPDNLPVPPSSPDGRMSAFRQRPDALGDTPSIPWTRNALE